MANINFKLSATNLGPHDSLSFSEQVSSLKTVIYANNGSGKTFLSRAVRLTTNPDIEKSEKLISFSQTKSSFNLEIENQADHINRTLKLTIENGKEPVFENNTDYIFHVFNSDYVNENVEKLGYKPNGNIEGYILGKDVIDLTAEKAELDEIDQKVEVKRKEFNELVKKHKQELDSLSIKSNTTEYISFNDENIFNSRVNYSEATSFDELKKENTILNTLPDNTTNVPTINSELKHDFFNGIKELLLTKYDRSYFSDEFKKKIREKQEFIETGLKFKTQNNCPFCEQELGETAYKLIDEYTKYLADHEAKIITEINSNLQKITLLEKQIKASNSSFLRSKIDFDKLKSYLPSFKEKNLENFPSTDDFEASKIQLNTLLEQKKSDITLTFEVAGLNETIKHIANGIEVIEKTLQSCNKLIGQINAKKDNISSEKLVLKKRLCKAKHIFLTNASKQLVAEIKENQQKSIALKAQIAEKENKVKELKKDKVAESFERFLNEFFAGKYLFDKDKFCLRFKTNNLIDNASDVLSEGEKSIVAFCFFLAETHTKVTFDDDYKKLFFVMDDPISSLDFHYVYSVAQIIRSLEKIFQLQFPRFLILTHNIEFMSILIRNKILDNKFVLTQRGICKLKDELVMPYESHLQDIYRVSIKQIIPSHTTPNSIRHVLETINKFDSPNEEFKIYVEKITEFEGSHFIYSLIHDNSHGNIRLQKAFTEDMLIEACDKVVSFVEAKFNGQIVKLKANS